MLRSYEFYERHLNLKSYEIDKIARIIKDVENGIYNEDEIRSLEADGLKFCICEGKYEIFEKLVSPFEYQDGDKVGYKYLLDAITLGIVEYINSLPRSIIDLDIKSPISFDVIFPISILTLLFIYILP